MRLNAENGVIVAGAGPVGLTLALSIQRAGLPVTVLEKRGSVNEQSKASTFHASTLDILEGVGVLEHMMKTGSVIPQVQYRLPSGKMLAKLDFHLLKGRVRNPFRLHFEQADLTKLLRDIFLQAGGTLHFNTGLSDLKQDDNGVTVIGSDGSRHKGAVLFGCDGAQSAAREAARIGYVEKPYPGMVLRLYVQMDMREFFPDLGGIVYLHEEDDACSLLEMHDCWRVVVRVPDGTSEAEAVSDEWVTKRLSKLLPIAQILPQVSGRDVYSARCRRALAASAGRVYLAGDALHLTNTKGGMNLNAGIHDAMAYAAAMTQAAATNSTAPLDRVAFERERVTREILIPRTDENVGTGSERIKWIAALSQDKAKTTEFLAKQAMLDMLDGLPADAVGNGGAHG